MAGNEQITDTLAGFALFADLERPTLERVVHSAEEAWFPAGTASSAKDSAAPACT